MSEAPLPRPWAARYRAIRFLDVIRARNVTPRMRRVTLGGPEMADLPDGPIIKLIVPPPGVGAVAWPSAGPELVWPPDEVRPAVRTYTVRRHDRAAGELDVDFVLHGDGPAAAWAARARPGDPVGISRPGGRKIAPAGWSLIAGDHTALPAIGAMLETMPRESRGRAVIEVPGPEDEQLIDAPPGLAVSWLHAPAGSGALVEAVRIVTWPESDDVAVWIGAESDTTRALRSYARDERGVERRRLLAIGYWRRGMSETAYKAAHDNDRDADYFAAEREEQRSRGEVDHAA